MSWLVFPYSSVPGSGSKAGSGADSIHNSAFRDRETQFALRHPPPPWRWWAAREKRFST